MGNYEGSLICEICDEPIVAGENYYEHENGQVCCSDDDCMKQLLYDIHEHEFKECNLMTYDEYEAERGDQQYDEMRDEGYRW